MRNSFLLLSGFHTWVCMCKSYLNSFSLYSKGLYLFTIWIFLPLFVKNMSTFVNRGINTLKPKPVIPTESIADKHIVKKIWLSELEWKELTFLLLLYYFVLSLITLLLLIRQYFSTVYVSRRVFGYMRSKHRFPVRCSVSILCVVATCHGVLNFEGCNPQCNNALFHTY